MGERPKIPSAEMIKTQTGQEGTPEQLAEVTRDAVMFEAARHMVLLRAGRRPGQPSDYDPHKVNK